MIISEKSHQNLSDYNQFLFKKRFEFDKKQIFSSEKWEIQVIVFMIMLTRSSKRSFNPMRYTGGIVHVACIPRVILYTTSYLNYLGP